MSPEDRESFRQLAIHEAAKDPVLRDVVAYIAKGDEAALQRAEDKTYCDEDFILEDIARRFGLRKAGALVAWDLAFEEITEETR